MRDIKFIVIHCTATPQNTTIDSIKNYWKNVMKWKSPGYHYIIEANGNMVQLQDEAKPTNGVAGHNSYSIHISYIGGVDKNGKPIDNRTPKQEQQMFKKVLELKEKYPNAVIQGHRDFEGVKKDCPSFDVKQWLNTRFN